MTGARGRVASPLALSPTGQFRCPHCDTVYDVEHLHFPMQDESVEICEDCGKPMANWKSSIVPVFKKA
ncbi:MAG: putative Zn finger-like uncharacterized protein [Paracoccaceae bacterium]